LGVSSAVVNSMQDLVVCRPFRFWGGSENFFYINAFLELKSSSEAKAPGDGLQHCLDLWEYLRGILCVFQSLAKVSTKPILT